MMKDQNSTRKINFDLPAPVAVEQKAKNDHALTLQVRPKSVEVTEMLVYKAEIGSRTNIMLVSSSGKVEIRVPYDGAEHFGKREIDKAKKALASKAVCGYVGMERPDAGPMDKPIKVPIEICCDDLDQYVATGSEAVMSVEYATPEIGERLVYVDATLVDETPVEDWRHISQSFTEQLRLLIRVQSDVGNISQTTRREILERVEGERKKAQEIYDRRKNFSRGSQKDEKQDLLKDATDRLNRLIKLSESLKKIFSGKIKEFTTEAVSEAIVRAKKEDGEYIGVGTKLILGELKQFVEKSLGDMSLTYAGIKWPHAEQDSRVDEQNEWQYNPEPQCMERRNIPMKWDQKSRTYEVELALNLYQPAESMPTIRGQIILETDKLVSEVEPYWIDSEENISDEPPLSFKTVIKLDIEEIRLPEIFERRGLFPRRQLVFKGVLPTVERIHEVENVLGDVGLTILYRSYDTNIEAENLIEGCWLEATKRQIGSPMKVWVLLRGTQKSGKHTVIYDGERQRLESDVPMGDLRVELFARIVGSASVISGVLDDIQFRLQQVFENVSSMV